MKIDIMFLVSVRMGFGHRVKNSYYSLFLKERVEKNSDHSLDHYFF